MNRKWLFILITLLSLTFFSHATFAADSDPCQSGASAPIFNNICYPHDASYRLLYEFFAPAWDDSNPLPWPWAKGSDQIPQIPHTAQNVPTNPFLAPLFKTFNQAMLSLAAIVILYTLFTALLGATHRGEFMGGKAHSMWLPLRSVAGFVMIIPTVSGYSLIQLCMLWVILQGVSLANSLVQRTLHPPTIKPLVDTTSFNYTQNIKTLEKNLSCIYTKYYPLLPYSSIPFISHPSTPAVLQENTFQCNTFDDKNGVSGYSFNFWMNSVDPSQRPKIKVCCRTDASSDKCSYPGVGWVLYPCGSITWPVTSYYDVTPSTSVSVPIASLIQPIYAGIINKIFQASSDYTDYENAISSVIPPNPYDNINLVTLFSPALNQIEATIVAALPSSSTSSAASASDDMNGEGWATSGAYFYQALMRNQPSPSSPSGLKNPYPLLINLDSIGISQNKFSGSALSDDMALVQFLTTMTPPPGGSTLTASIMQFAINIIAPGPDQTPTIGIGSNHPLIRIQILGQYILGILTAFIAAMTVAAFAAGLVSHIVSAVNPVWGVWDTLIKIVTAPAELLAGLAYAGAISMTIYIPMIPYIIFSFGVIGWLIAVLETLLAAPLVAMGLTYPEGHEMWGKADPALMLLANVFLRPAFMIFGLFAGIVVSQIAIWFINDTILTVMTGVLSNPGTPLSSWLGQLISVLLIPFYIAVYVLLIITILNRSFALISIIPDQILKWIGGQTQLGEYAPKGAEEVKQGFAPMASKAASGVGSAAPAAGSYGGAIGKELHKDKPKATDTAAATVKPKEP